MKDIYFLKQAIFDLFNEVENCLVIHLVCLWYAACPTTVQLSMFLRSLIYSERHVILCIIEVYNSIFDMQNEVYNITRSFILKRSPFHCGVWGKNTKWCILIKFHYYKYNKSTMRYWSALKRGFFNIWSSKELYVHEKILSHKYLRDRKITVDFNVFYKKIGVH